MRRKKERSKQGQTNKQANKATQHSTPKAVTFPKKNELPRVGLEPTTLDSRQSTLPLSYQDNSAGWTQISHLIVHVRIHTLHPNTHSLNTGKDLIEWLISWSFARDRSAAASLATDMLRNGFFHTINLDTTTCVLVLSKDGVLSRYVVDNEDAKYVFVSAGILICAISSGVGYWFSIT